MILSQSRSLEEELNAEMVSHATHIYFLEEALRIAQASNPSVAHAKKSGSRGWQTVGCITEPILLLSL
jgi:hypothetical protein